MTKKEFLKAVIFVTLFLVLLTMVTYIVRTNGDVKDRFTGFYAEPDDTIDVIMIGSSPVYPYYATPKMWGEYGITAYPLSSNLQRPVAAPYLVEEAEKTQNPSIYLFELRMYTAREQDLTNNMAYTRGVTDNLKYSANRIRTINAMVEDQWERYTYYFDIFKYHSNWKTMIMPSQLACFRYERADDLKGYVITDEVGPCERVDTSLIQGETPIPAEQEKALRELLAKLKKDKLQALFFLSPTVVEEEKQPMYHYMQRLIEEAGFEFLDMNTRYEEIGLDYTEDFSDYGGHTNAVGADKCTRFLAEYLQDHYQIADRREEAGFESWDLAYDLWKKEFEKAKVVIENRILTGDFAEIAAEVEE